MKIEVGDYREGLNSLTTCPILIIVIKESGP